MTSQTVLQQAVGPGLKARRTALGLSRERLGAAAGGISSATIRRIEFGIVKPQPQTLVALARALYCSPSDLNDHEPAARELVEKERDDPAQSGE